MHTLTVIQLSAIEYTKIQPEAISVELKTMGIKAASTHQER
jgi:hypothetical protein